MGIRVDEEGGNYSIILTERFDFGCVEQFRSAYESVTPKGRSIVTIDFKATKYIDSSALGMLINAKGHLGDDEVKVVLANCNSQIKKIFSISRFDKKFDIS